MNEVSPKTVRSSELFTIVPLLCGPFSVHQPFTAVIRHATADEEASPVDLSEVVSLLEGEFNDFHFRTSLSLRFEWRSLGASFSEDDHVLCLTADKRTALANKWLVLCVVNCGPAVRVILGSKLLEDEVTEIQAVRDFIVSGGHVIVVLIYS